MDLLDVKNLLISRIKGLSVCIPNSTETQWQVRCPYCRDSRDPRHGHFSILINRNSDDCILYRCFKCNESGLFTSETADALGLGFTSEEDAAIDKLNHPSGKSSYFRSKPKKFDIPPIVNPAAVQSKLGYLKMRLGVDFDGPLIQQCRIVLSLVDFINANHINPSTLDWKTVQNLENNYVGFLSANNNKITFRRIRDDGGLRYFKWTIDPLNSTPNNFYSAMARQVDLLDPNPITICMAEGTFDILGVMLNLWHLDSQSPLFYGSCGFSFSTIVKFLIYTGIGTNMNIHVYADNDKTDKEIERMILSGRNGIWVEHLTIHRNTYGGEKDFGVPGSRIIDSSRIIR